MIANKIPSRGLNRPISPIKLSLVLSKQLGVRALPRMEPVSKVFRRKYSTPPKVALGKGLGVKLHVQVRCARWHLPPDKHRTFRAPSWTRKMSAPWAMAPQQAAAVPPHPLLGVRLI